MYFAQCIAMHIYVCTTDVHAIEAVTYFSKPLRLRDYISKLVKLLFVCLWV